MRGRKLGRWKARGFIIVAFFVVVLFFEISVTVNWKFSCFAGSAVIKVLASLLHMKGTPSYYIKENIEHKCCIRNQQFQGIHLVFAPFPYLRGNISSKSSTAKSLFSFGFKGVPNYTSFSSELLNKKSELSSTSSERGHSHRDSLCILENSCWFFSRCFLMLCLQLYFLFFFSKLLFATPQAHLLGTPRILTKTKSYFYVRMNLINSWAWKL